MDNDQNILESSEVSTNYQGELEIKEVEPWESIKNILTRREQKFLRSVETHWDSIVEMTTGKYKVTSQGWRKISD